jgi:hypothetical protein
MCPVHELSAEHVVKVAVRILSATSEVSTVATNGTEVTCVAGAAE